MRFYWLILAIVLAAGPARANDFATWLQDFKARAAAEISPRTLAALDSVEFLDRVIELDQSQPESTLMLDEYIEKTVSPIRIAKGREMMAAHRPLLQRVAAAYGVPAKYIVALWGKETNYGAHTGGFFVLDALATLAYEGRRAQYFEGELLQALRIIDAGHISADDMKGSWAGAMGQCQFMPTSFFNYAVDGNGDGRRDIWADLPDVFASMANYLKSEGWDAGQEWGHEVRLAQQIPESAMGFESPRSYAEWAQMGITTANGSALPNSSARAMLIQPDGPGTNAYLVTNNFRVLMHWNRSRYFATAVGLLADAVEKE